LVTADAFPLMLGEKKEGKTKKKGGGDGSNKRMKPLQDEKLQKFPRKHGVNLGGRVEGPTFLCSCMPKKRNRPMAEIAEKSGKQTVKSLLRGSACKGRSRRKPKRKGSRGGGERGNVYYREETNNGITNYPREMLAVQILMRAASASLPRRRATEEKYVLLFISGGEDTFPAWRINKSRECLEKKKGEDAWKKQKLGVRHGAGRSNPKK